MAQATAAGKGLEGVTATTSAISSIIGSTLTYRGIDINELAEHSTFEEVAYLLWYGELPSQDQLDRFKQELISHRAISSETIDFIRRFPRDANSMVSLRTAVSALAFADPLAADMSADANNQKAVALLAQFPVLVAAIHRLRCGEEPVSPDPNLGEAANFWYMLTGDRPTDSRLRRDMPDREATSPAAESPVAYHRHVITETGAEDRTCEGRQLRHTRPPGRPFVAEHDGVTRLDVASLHRLKCGSLVIKHPRRSAMGRPRLVCDLHD